MSVITVKGNVTRDPKLFTPQGSERSVITISVANNDHQVKDSGVDGGYRDVPVYYDISFWVRNADYWMNRIQVGCKCVADCNGVHINAYLDNSGNPKASICANVLGNPDIIPKHQQQNDKPY
jgi:hypothetical protein